MKYWMTMFAAISIATSAHATQLVDQVVAIVNNDVITQRQVDGLLASMGPILRQPGADIRQLRTRAVERLIDERLLEQAMAKEKLELTAEEVDQAFAQFLTANRLNADQFRMALAQRGMSVEQFRAQMNAQLRQMKFIQTKLGGDIQLKEQELQNFYRRHVNAQTPEMSYHISEIVLPAPNMQNDRDVQTTKKKAGKIAQHARTDDFRKIAKKYSTSNTAADGGERGNVALNDLRPELAMAVQRLRVGEVSEPVVTSDGVFIVKLNAMRSATDQDFQQRKPQIQQVVFQDKMTEALEQYLGKLRAKAYIEIR